MNLKFKPVNLQENILLANHTTFRIGGPARYFLTVKNEEEILAAIKFAKENNLEFFILGGGSNLLVSDKGFNGLVIKNQNSSFKIEGNKINSGVGVFLGKILLESTENNLTGLEWAIGIPGTIGGAVSGNAGAYGHSISELVKKVRVLKAADLTFRHLTFNDCGFVYRGSIFKETQDIIISVELGLVAGNRAKSEELIKDTLAQRQGKIPPFPSAGSFFKNYRLRNKDYLAEPLLKNFPDLAKKVRSGKIGVGYLIEECSLKGVRVGGAMVAEEHANFIVNAGGATAADVLALAKLCQKKVREKFGINLDIEKKLIGF
jgi:UDP-N-acetylmuramate dehydrogenase